MIKKIIKKQYEDQRGIALIAIVVMLAILIQYSTMEIVLLTTTQVKETDTWLAVRNGEEVGLATISEIKVDLAEQVAAKMKTELESRLEAYLGKEISVCQGPIAGLSNLSEQYAICEPEKLFNSLKGASNGTIDLLTLTQPTQTKPVVATNNPNFPFRQWMLGEQQREAYNSFDYTVRVTYVGGELIKEATPAKTNLPGVRPSPPQPRIEQYRYLVESTITTSSYSAVESKLKVDFDLILSVSIFDPTTPMSNCSATPRGTNNYSSVVVLGFCEPFINSKGEQDYRCAGLNTDKYTDDCGGKNGKPDDCKGDIGRALRTCPDGGCTIMNPSNPALKGDIAIGVGADNTSRVFGGCAQSGGILVGVPGYNNNSYTWTALIRTVGIGNSY
jgi:hypothetical protein